jgi:hypothetical protein
MVSATALASDGYKYAALAGSINVSLWRYTGPLSSVAPVCPGLLEVIRRALWEINARAVDLPSYVFPRSSTSRAWTRAQSRVPQQEDPFMLASTAALPL